MVPAWVWLSNARHLDIAAAFVPVPLFVAFAALSFFGERPKSGLSRIAAGGAISSLVLAGAALAGVLGGGPVDWVLFRRPLPFGLYVDRLTVVMLLLVTGVSSIVHLYSVRYMQGEPHYNRFIARLSLTTGSVALLVMANNLVMLFGSWLLTGLSVVLLLAHNCERPQACRATRRVLIIYGIGDAAFALGVIAAYRLFGTVDYRRLFHLAAAHVSASGHRLDAGPALAVMALLFFIGIMARSAQFPLHVWMTDTVDAPTPVSALLHAGIVNIGGFLLARLSPLFTQSAGALHVIFLVGTVTAFFGTGVMLVQNDTKRMLAFSTVGQMGFMVMEAGLAAYATAVFHLMSHGLFKATLFLGSGQLNRPSRHQPEAGRTMKSRTAALIGSAVVVAFVFYAVSHHAPSWRKNSILLIFAAATLTQAAVSIVRFSRSWPTTVALTFLLAAILAGYWTEIDWFNHFLAATIAPVPQKLGGTFDVVGFSVVAGFSLLSAAIVSLGPPRHPRVHRWIDGYRQTLYVFIANQGYISDIARRLYQLMTEKLSRRTHTMR